MAKEMRAVFGETLAAMMQKDENIIVLDADLAKANGTWNLRHQFPERALDVGVAEQNMTSMAAGLAAYGFIPFITSFTPFATRRVCDQLTISVCYAKQNVKIVGTDPGIAAELNGGTHMSFEDIGVLRSIPNLVIYEPVDNVQFAQALPAIVNYHGPVYIRMFRKAVEDFFPADYKFDLFTADKIIDGQDVSIFATGIMVAEAKKAVDILATQGIKAELINVHTIKPIDEATIIASAQKTGCVVTCENHNIIGGLRSAVSEVLMENCPVPLASIGVTDHFGEVAKIDYLWKKYRMTANDIVDATLGVIAKKR